VSCNVAVGSTVEHPSCCLRRAYSSLWVYRVSCTVAGAGLCVFATIALSDCWSLGPMIAARTSPPGRNIVQAQSLPAPWRIVEILTDSPSRRPSGSNSAVFYGRAEPNIAGHTGFPDFGRGATDGNRFSQGCRNCSWPWAE